MEIIFSPICIALGIQKEIGRTVTENALKVGQFVALTGTLQRNSDKLSMVPEFITTDYSKTRSIMLWRVLKFVPFQLLFAGLGIYFYRKSQQYKHKLEKPQVILNAQDGFKCHNCDKNCEVLFKPCMDICCCLECAKNVRDCPRCGKEIGVMITIHSN